MKIDFTLTEEDYLDITMMHMKGSKKFKSSFIAQRFVIPFLVCLVVFDVAKHFGFIPAIIACVALYIGWVLLFPKYYKNSALKKIRKISAKSGEGGPFGNCSIDITSEGVVSSNKEGSLRTNWKRVNKVQETEKFLLIYVDNTNCCVLPLRAFKDQDERKIFMNILKKHCEVEQKDFVTKG
ncbi:YcxB family protein [Clostridium cellulovorans]|uniref:YcxB-like C-terminal domain-containing protein n=1 Tax=Clostridium cellulovorans (strain ATCC 35296 / DSM 3052 / OCM 3 / 743B) TaxID=573061 RepID=D9SPN7_CLOC7|nr:YcxB family protein [Clostridium cellulovorans]ADL50086.1 hypothetical protein Clocel_0306 [Clostridium cellulovorans 743B]